MKEEENSRRGTETQSGFFWGIPPTPRGGRGGITRRRFFSATLSLCGCFLSSCGKEPPPPPPPPPPAPAIPQPELPPVADATFPDWNEVEDETFLELPKPATLDPLRWNFAKGERFGYEFTQTHQSRMESRSGGTTGMFQARERSRGTFEFIAGKDRTALVFLKFHTEEAFRDGVPAPREAIEKAPQSKFEAIAKEDGSAEIVKPPGRSDATFFFDALLTLGDGERKLKDGWVRTKSAGFAKVGRYDCVRLESEFEFAPTSGLGATLQRGRTVAWFAPRERRFVRASTVAITSTRTKARSPEGGAWIVTLVDSRTLLRAKLLDTP